MKTHFLDGMDEEFDEELGLGLKLVEAGLVWSQVKKF